MSSIRIMVTDITAMETDCIVNAANGRLQRGSGVCGAIFRAADAEKLQAACNAIGGCPTGSAVITPSFGLKAKYVVHAVGPVWHGGGNNEPEDLYHCYRASLDRAKENNCHSIAFPLISSGIFGYPKEAAWKQAIKANKDWISENPDHEMDIVFAVLDQQAKDLGDSILAAL